MPQWITEILAILGLVAQDAPLIENILSGIGTYIAAAFSSLFGSSAAVELQAALADAEQIVAVIEADIPAAEDFIKNAYADIEALLAAFPNLAPLLYGTTQIQNNHKLDSTSALQLFVAAHANAKAPGMVAKLKKTP